MGGRSWSNAEKLTIVQLLSIDASWAAIEASLPGRSATAIRFYIKANRLRRPMNTKRMNVTISMPISQALESAATTIDVDRFDFVREAIREKIERVEGRLS